MKVLSGFTPAVCAVAIAMATSGIAMAEVVDSGVTFTVGGSYHDFDSYRKLDNTVAPELGLGYRFDDRWSLEAIYSERKTDQKNNNDARVKNYRLDAFYDLQPWDGSLTPYLVAGIGELDEHLQHAKDRDDTRMNAGIGLRTALTPNLSLRGDVRAVRSLDYNQTESMMNVALTWTFGSVGKPTQQVAAAPLVAEPVQDPVVEPAPQPLDTDNDGVPDSADLCPDSAPGAVVNAAGCVGVEKINLHVEFGFDSAEIRPEAADRIAEMGEYLQRHRDVGLLIEGHTDSSGPAAYNKKLSQKRVDAVRQILIDKHGIEGSRIEAVGLGESQPIADNSTKEGRQENRRVTAEIVE